MAIEPVPHIGLAPDPGPQRGDPDTFDDRVDALVEWWETSPAQLNALVDGVTNNANEAHDAAVAAAGSAAIAEDAATMTVAAADLVATSTTSLAVGVGLKNFVVQPGKQFKPNMPVRLGLTASPGTYMDGYVRTYNGTTGDISIQVQQKAGTGTFTSWTLMITGAMNLASFFGGGGSSIWHGLGTYGGPSYDPVLDAASEKLQVATVASGGGFTLPSPGEVPYGYNLFEFHNRVDGAYNNDMTFKDYLGKVLAFLPPNRSTPAHLGSDSTWIFPEASPVGKPLRFSATAASRIAGSAGTFVRAVPLDASRTLFLVHGISVHAVVYDASSNSWGGLTMIRSALAGNGAIDNVVALKIDADNVLVASCPENGTNLHMVVLTMSGTTVTPGTAQTTATGVAAARLLEIIAVGTSFVLGYVNSSGVPRMQARTVSGATVSPPGVEVVGVTGTAPPALLTGPSTTFAVMTSTATVASVTPYTVTGTSIATGTAATVSVTSITGINLRQSDLGRWLMTAIGPSGIARVSAISFSGASVAISSALSVSSAVATISSIQMQQWGFDAQVAVTGTDASGGFLTEFSGITDSGSGAPTMLMSIIARASAAAQTLTPMGSNFDGVSSSTIAAWMISTAKGNELHTFLTVTNSVFSAVKTFRIGPMSVAAGVPPQALYPKQQLHNSVLSKFGSLACSALGDGTKAALYSGVGNDLGTMRTSPQLITDPVNGAKGADQGSLWLAYSVGVDAILTLEQVRIA